tara:strand:+ start:35 stop:412 length:378 start_codon:yes stop_codon:yes gene_type:complete
MGYNMSSDIALGQLGSGFLDTNSEDLLPPTGKVIIAITMMHDAVFQVLLPELPTDATFKGPQTSAGVAETNCIGIATQTAANGADSQVVDTSNKFPKGITIYGRWKQLRLQTTDTTGGVIAYYGY